MSNIDYAAKLDQAQAELVNLKEQLVLELQISLGPDSNYLSSEAIAKSANRIAEAEGEVRAMSILAGAQKQEMDLKSAILRHALRSPDDEWSGRTNDVRRAFADGLRTALEDSLWDIK